MTLQQLKLMFASYITCLKELTSSMASASGCKQGPDAMTTADSSLQPGCTGSGPAVSLPQSFFLPKEFGQTWDQFSPANEQTSPISSNTHSFFSAGDDDDEQQRYKHPGEPIITLRRFA